MDLRFASLIGMELLDFLSGLLLTLVVLGVLAYVVKEIATDAGGDPGKVRDYVERYVPSGAKPVNDHLIGTIGKLVARPDEGAGSIRVRVGPEYWQARWASSEEIRLPIGAAVRVTAVDGSTLIVEPGPDQPQSAAAETP